MAGKICMSRILFSILLCVIFYDILPAQSLRSKINEGNKKYHEENYDEALNKYQDALLDDPQHEIAHFNEGDANYKMEKFDKAIESYEKVLGSKDLKLEQEAHFNIGNSYFKQDKLQESIEAYKKALNIDPNDKDAKYNLELARAKLKEMADKQQQQPQQQQNQKQQGQQQNEQGQGDENQQEQQQQKQQQQEQQQQANQNEKEKDEKQGESLEESKDKMSQEDAKRILDALKNDEQDNQKLRKPVKSGQRSTEKDW